MSEKRTFGAASRSSPSLRWNSSRCSSGTSPTSRKLITWPSFIAAPFIVPSAATICSAASRLRRSSAACLPSSERPRLAARVPRWRAACPAARPDTRAVRATREVGIRSLAIRVWASRSGSASPRAARGSRSAWASPSAPAWPSVRVAVGSALSVARRRRGRRRRRLVAPEKNVVRPPSLVAGPPSTSSETVSADDGDRECRRAGRQRELPVVLDPRLGRAGRMGRPRAPARSRSLAAAAARSSGSRTAAPVALRRVASGFDGSDLLGRLAQRLGHQRHDHGRHRRGEQRAPLPDHRHDHRGRHGGRAEITSVWIEIPLFFSSEATPLF